MSQVAVLNPGARSAIGAMPWEIGRTRWLSCARGVVLVCSDLAALAIAAAAAAMAVPVLPKELAFVPPWPLLCSFVIGYGAAGLYPGFGLGAVETIRRLSIATSLGFLLLAIGALVLTVPPEHYGTSFLIGWGAAIVLVPLCRSAVLAEVRKLSWWDEPVLLVGSAAWRSRIEDFIGSARALGYRPIGALPMVSDGKGDRGIVTGLDLASDFSRRGVRTVLLEDDEHAVRRFEVLRDHFAHIVMMHGCEPLPVDRVEVRRFGDLVGVEFSNGLLDARRQATKRIVDVAVAALVLVFAAPLVLIGGLLVKLVSRGPMFYSQERAGLGERPIRVWKLRTMYVDAERRLEEHLASSPELRREWEERFKLSRDPRIVPWVGSLLRRLSIDELPQLWSVVVGDMSLVGPRPFPDYHLARFSAEFRRLRHRVRPGITGMWQVMVRSRGGLEEQKRFDTYYVHHWSIWLDLYILARTAFVVISTEGAC